MEVTEEPTSTEEYEVTAELVKEPDDDGPTVEEEYEVTTTRRKTVRTSYKIQEVSAFLHLFRQYLFIATKISSA